VWGSDRLRKRVRDLEERVETLELAQKSGRLELLELMDKITRRLEWRERKRVEAEQLEPELELEDDSRALGYARRFRNHERRS